MNIEALKSISVEVMKAQVKEHMRKWNCFSPIIQKETDEIVELKESVDANVKFCRPHLEDWTPAEGLGRALCRLVKDPGMHGSAMDLYGSNELCKLEELRLSNFCGEPTELGKAVAAALND